MATHSTGRNGVDTNSNNKPDEDDLTDIPTDKAREATSRPGTGGNDLHSRLGEDTPGTPARVDPFAAFDVTVIDQTYADFAEDDAADAVPVGAPPRFAFVRTATFPLLKPYLLRHKEGALDRGTFFMVTPEIAGLLPDDVGMYALHLYVDREGREGIWPLRIDRKTPYFVSERAAARRATREWVRILWVPRDGGGERVARPSVRDFGEPPWSGRDKGQLLELAFADRRITSKDHPIVVALLGS